MKPERIPLVLRMEPGLLAQIDQRRGLIPRNAFINQILLQFISKKISAPSGSSEPAPEAPAPPVPSGSPEPAPAKPVPAKEIMQRPSSSSWGGLSLGKPRPELGSMLKSMKKK